MRCIIVSALLAALPWAVSAAPVWQNILSDPSRHIELDRTSIKREEGGKVIATGRIILARELPDAKSGGTYRVIEATTRYDCTSRNAMTVKRVFKKNEDEMLREEEPRSAELPVRSGTLDDKVLREVCRPAKEDVKAVVAKANQAGAELKHANEALVRAELTKQTPRGAPLKVVERESQGLLVSREMERHADGGMPVSAPQPARKARSAGRGKASSRLAEAAEAAQRHASVHWSYEGDGGPENWYRLDPGNSLCGTGQRQSPIDIRDGIKVDLEPIQFDYKPSLFRIVDNGHTVQVEVGEGRLTITGKTYELVQFHFHKPAEEKINGRGFPMVAHLVHRADDGKLAVVSVLLERGEENPLVQTLWNNLPLEKNTEVLPPTATVDLAAFLPKDRNYYTYMGSLTTPPCTEGVLWLVLRQPVQVSQEQINIFSRLYRNNARPIQASWGRLIKEGR